MSEGQGITDWEEVRDRLSAHVGRSVRRELGVQTALQFQRFGVASGLAVDDAVTLDTEQPIAAPPLYLSAVLGWQAGPAESELRADGTGPADMAGLPVEGLRLMGAGQSLEFLAPLLSGTSVTMEVSVSEVELKSGRSGPFIVVSLLRRYFDDADVELLRCRENFVGR